MFLTGDPNNTVLQGYLVYDSDSEKLENFQGNLYELMSSSRSTCLPMISSENKVLTIIANNSYEIDPFSDHQLFFRIRQIHAANCKDAYNVYAASTLTTVVNGIASGNSIADYCQLELLYANDFGLPPGILLTQLNFEVKLVLLVFP
uniref:Uncharacterized protein n=1 Tax=Acrobeloides nanus TaxID=290746 RepID=A0A914DCC9_9BILA